MDAVSLEAIYGSLSMDERLQVVDAIAQFMDQMRAITFLKSGKLVPARNTKPPDDGDINTKLLPWKHASIGNDQPSDSTGTTTTTDQHAHYTQKLDDALEQMAEDPFFMATAGEPSCLFFRDLLPNKVFLTKNKVGIWTVSYLACNDAWSLKETIAASPPSWLWGGICEHLSLLPQATTTSPPRILGGDKFTLKKRYDHAMSKGRDGDHYMKQTYGLGKWFRRLMHCQLFILPINRNPDQEIDNFIQGWAQYAELHGLNTTTISLRRKTPEQPPMKSSLKSSNSGAKRSVHFQDEPKFEDHIPPADDKFAIKKAQVVRLCAELGIVRASDITDDIIPDLHGYTRFSTRDHQQYVLHTDGAQAIKDEVASTLAAGTMVSVPRIVAYDTNQADGPYVLYEALPGAGAGPLASLKYSLHNRLPHTKQSPLPLARQNRLPLLRQLAAVSTALAGKRLSSPGKLTPDPQMPDSAIRPKVRDTGIQPFVDNTEFLRHGLVGSISQMLKHQALKAEEGLAKGRELIRAYRNLYTVLCQMSSAGLLANPAFSECVLVNINTRASNVFVTEVQQRQNEVSFKLEGIMSWRGAVSLPKIFAFPPPSWIWRVNMAQGGYWWLAPMNEPSIAKNPDDHAVMVAYKAIRDQDFRSIFGVTDEPGTPLQMIRRLGYFALEGQLGKDQNWRIYTQFLEDWNDYCRSRWWFDSVPRIQIYKFNRNDTIAASPHEWDAEWKTFGAGTSSAPTSTQRHSTSLASSSEARRPSFDQPNAARSKLSVPSTPNSPGFKGARVISDLTIAEREKYFEVESRVRDGTTFLSITDALHRSNGHSKDGRPLIPADAPPPAVHKPFSDATHFSHLTIPQRFKYSEVEYRVPRDTASLTIADALHKCNGSVNDAVERITRSPPAVHKGFRDATNFSDLTISQQFKYNEVRSRVPKGTNFLTITDALCSRYGSVNDAVDLITGKASRQGSRAEIAQRAGPLSTPSASCAPPLAVHKGFRHATHTSELNAAERETYNRVQSSVVSGTTFAEITSALARTGGSITGAVDLITRLKGPRAPPPQPGPPGTPRGPSIKQATALGPPPNMSNAAVPAGPRASQPLSSSFPTVPGGPRMPQVKSKPRPSSSAPAPGPPRTSSQHRVSLGAPPSTAPRSAPPAPKANPPRPASTKRPIVIDDDASVERELKKSKVDRRMEKAREVVNTAMEPRAQYPQQIYKREDGALQERNGNLPPRADRGRAPSPDDECVITEIRKLKSSSEDEDSESMSESSGESENGGEK